MDHLPIWLILLNWCQNERFASSTTVRLFASVLRTHRTLMAASVQRHHSILPNAWPKFGCVSSRLFNMWVYYDHHVGLETWCRFFKQNSTWYTYFRRYFHLYMSFFVGTFSPVFMMEIYSWILMGNDVNALHDISACLDTITDEDNLTNPFSAKGCISV